MYELNEKKKPLFFCSSSNIIRNNVPDINTRRYKYIRVIIFHNVTTKKKRRNFFIKRENVNEQPDEVTKLCSRVRQRSNQAPKLRNSNLMVKT